MRMGGFHATAGRSEAAGETTNLLSPTPRRILRPMSLILDPATEARLQRQLDFGAYSRPDDLLTHALDLLEAEAVQADWLSANRDTVRTMFEESFAAKERGESYTLEEARAILSERFRSHPPLTPPL